MKHPVAICLISGLTLVSSALAGSPSPALTSSDLQDFAQNVSKAGNFSLAISPAYAPKLNDGAWGLAVFGGYQFNEFAGAYLRADLLDGNSYVASGSVTAQYPITFGKLVVRPFIEAGAGSALGGAGDKNHDPFAIAGGGAAIDFWRSHNGKFSLSAFGAVETWEPVYHGIAIYRAGAIARVNF